MLISFTVINFSSDTRVSKHQVVVLKCIQFLFLNVTSVKLVTGEEDRNGGRAKLLERDHVPWCFLKAAIQVIGEAQSSCFRLGLFMQFQETRNRKRLKVCQ